MICIIIDKFLEVEYVICIVSFFWKIDCLEHFELYLSKVNEIKKIYLFYLKIICIR